MKRLRRIIFNGLTVLSLLLCVATVVLWVRSSSVYDSLSFDMAGHSFQVMTPSRSLFVEWTDHPYFTPKWETEPPDT